jgi:hypothetical protein
LDKISHIFVQCSARFCGCRRLQCRHASSRNYP